jgi:NarL family two-component system sensor histidine kinase YdfH
MKSLDSLAQFIRQLFPPPFPAQEDEEREVRPFFIIVMVVLAFLYGRAIYVRPGLRDLALLIPFTGLMLLHAALYWFSTRLTVTLRTGILYLAVQGALAFVLIVLSREASMVMGLYLALIGQAAGILRKPLMLIVAVASYLALAAISFVLVSGWGSFYFWGLISVLMTLFVVVYVSLYSRQAEARARAQALLAELETAHRQLAEYATRVEDLTITTERQRMARELHDTLAQGLAGLILQLEAANSHLASGRTERAQAILQQALARARTSLADARRAIDDLRESAVVPQDLSEAVQAEVNRFTTATGIPCKLESDSIPPLPDALREHVLRIVSEALTNIARHAQANHAWAKIACESDRLEIEVHDDGRGFDPSDSEAGHYGLLGMRERARLAGGTLAVESAPGRGTTVQLGVPLAPDSTLVLVEPEN